MHRIVSWPVAFVRFWYHFIIGDDWAVAAAVIVALLVTALLNARGVVAWWLVPLVVIVLVKQVRLRQHLDRAVNARALREPPVGRYQRHVQCLCECHVRGVIDREVVAQLPAARQKLDVACSLHREITQVG